MITSHACFYASFATCKPLGDIELGDVGGINQSQCHKHYDIVIGQCHPTLCHPSVISKPCLFFTFSKEQEKKYDGYWLLVMCFTCVYLSCVEISVPLVGDGNMKTTFYFG